jgi:DNA-binding beta-propeller fold protein YncE
MNRTRVAAVVTVLALSGSAVGYAVTSDGVIGPNKHETGNGRVLHPVGHMTRVGNFPTGGALANGGLFYWAVSTGRGLNDIRIVNVQTNRVVQVIPIPGASGGITMDRGHNLAYVSGIADSTDGGEARPKLPGRDGDVVDVYKYDPRSGKAHFLHLLPVPPTSDAPIPQNFPPTNQTRIGWPDRLAVSPDGSKLLVPLNLADEAAIVNTKTKAVTYAKVGHYPYGAAISSNGKTGYVTNETDGTLSFVNMANGNVTDTVALGPRLSHPEAIVINTRTKIAYVTMANTDHVAVVNLGSHLVVANFSLVRKQGLGVSPVAAALDVPSKRLYVAEEGADDVAVLDISKTKPRLAGRIPTAAFPTDVAVGGLACKHVVPYCGRVVWLSGKAFGFGPNPNGPNPFGTGNYLTTYLPSAIRGSVGVMNVPGKSALAKMTPVAVKQMVPADRTQAPANTPLRPNGPIKHVFFIVKENRTYDQILGDLGRGDGDPKLELFNSDVTPNAHALANRFPLVDHLYANSEASIDGHFWTSAGAVSDYVQKNWMQNYGGRGRPYDFGVYAATWPGTGFLFDQAEREGISYFNYGEAIAGTVPVFPDKDRTNAMQQEELKKFSKSDLGTGFPSVGGVAPGGQCYPNDADIETDAITQQQTYDSTPPTGAPAGAESRFDCFNQRFQSQLAANSVPAFNYLVLPNDHTVGTTPGKRTPQALVADNDYGLGQIVDTISHSSIWDSSAIFVVEDDSQDGADHVDAHRIPAWVISPYTKPGAIVAHRYDFVSAIRSMELILGMEPLGLNDAVAEPMYAAFTATRQNAAPYTALVPKQDRLALNASNAADARLSASLDFRQLDQVPQQLLDRILWHAVYGENSTPPPPGPNAEDLSDN